jgi:hypothetical protein
MRPPTLPLPPSPPVSARCPPGSRAHPPDLPDQGSVQRAQRGAQRRHVSRQQRSRAQRQAPVACGRVHSRLRCHPTACLVCSSWHPSRQHLAEPRRAEQAQPPAVRPQEPDSAAARGKQAGQLLLLAARARAPASPGRLPLPAWHPGGFVLQAVPRCWRPAQKESTSSPPGSCSQGRGDSGSVGGHGQFIGGRRPKAGEGETRLRRPCLGLGGRSGGRACGRRRGPGGGGGARTS